MHVGFRGHYEGSIKTPDLVVEFVGANERLDPKFILEVGVSETYEQLVEEARLWLEGEPRVSVVLIIKFEESSPFQCPIQTIDDQRLGQLRFPDFVSDEQNNFVAHSNYGPVTYRGLQWFGGFSTVFAEVWRQDSTSGRAAQSGDRVVGYFPSWLDNN